MSAADRILNMIVRGVVRAWQATERGFNTLTVSLMADEPPDVHHFQPYGLASVPPSGADAMVFQPSGNADHLIAIVAGRGPDLASKETAVWNGFGWAVKLLEEDVRIDKDDGTPILQLTETRVDIGGLAGKAVVRTGDTVSLDPGWFGQVTAAVNGLAPASITATPSATVVASSVKVFAK